MNKTPRFKNIHTSNSEYCLDVYNGSKKSNTPIISYKCHSGKNQKFSYNKTKKQLRVKSSRKCLDRVGPLVVQKKCNSHKKTQKWNLKNKQYKTLKNKKCMDVMRGEYDNGLIITYPCHDGDNQKFQQGNV